MNNYLFDLKIRELQLLNKNFELLNDGILLIFEKNAAILMGCKNCYQVMPIATESGFKIDAGDLINYFNKYGSFSTLPPEIAIKCWLCPCCGRLFRELLPPIDTIYIT